MKLQKFVEQRYQFVRSLQEKGLSRQTKRDKALNFIIVVAILFDDQ